MGRGMTPTLKPGKRICRPLPAGAEGSVTFTPNLAVRLNGSALRGSIYHYSRRERGEKENFVGAQTDRGRQNGRKIKARGPVRVWVVPKGWGATKVAKGAHSGITGL